jgi:thioredoxin reductase (NADPH)
MRTIRNFKEIDMSEENTDQRFGEMFPVLTTDHVGRLMPYGEVFHFKMGEKILAQGQEELPFLLVLDGALAVDVPIMDTLRTVAVHRKGQFFGDIGMLTGRRSLVDVRAESDGQLLRIAAREFRQLVRRESGLSEVLMRAFMLRRVALVSQGLGDVVLIGHGGSRDTLRIQEFLARNAQPFAYFDLAEDPTVQDALQSFQVAMDDFPVVICRGKFVLRNPTNREVAECIDLNLGISTSRVRDVVVIGAGPAGLAAAVYAASEGLDVLVLESLAIGGQAGTSSKIENYLGFPAGISGQDLAVAGYAQAQKFSAEFLLAHAVTRIECDEQPYMLHLDSGDLIRSKSIVVATGVQYRKLDLPNLERFEGVGIYYGATFVEGRLCRDEEVIVVGGGNSAGQAAIFLSEIASHVHVFIRGENLESSMSNYLIRRITDSRRITLHPRTEMQELLGDEKLEAVVYADHQNGVKKHKAIKHLFLMTGAKPNTGWLNGCMELDDKGFVITGKDVLSTPRGLNLERNGMTPELLETSLPGVFAVGDVRSGNVKRVASAVGEGSIVIHLVHRFLEQLNTLSTQGISRDETLLGVSQG